MARNTFFEDEVIERKFDAKQLKRIMRYVMHYRFELFVGLTLMILASICSLSGPYISKIIMDNMIPNKDIRGILFMIAVFLGFLGLQIIFNIIKGFLMNRMGYSVVYDLRRDLFNHLQTLSFKFFDDRPTGKVLVRLTNYIDSLAKLLSDGIVNMVTDLVTLVAIVVIMFTIDVKLSFVSLATCVPLFIIAFAFRNIVKNRQVIMNHKNANRTAYVHENIMGVKIVQSFTREGENAETYDQLNKDCVSAWMRVFRVNQLFFPCVDITSVIGMCLTYFVGWLLLDLNAVTLGVIFAFSGYIGRFWQPINNMSAIYNQLLVAMANVESIFDIMEEPADIHDIEGAAELPKIKGDIHFEGVTFGYEPDVDILRDLSFDVKSGETVALVGPTGAGKTTVVNLISRFYDIAKGKITIDGTDIHSVTLNSLRRQMGIMMQDTFIFEGTILDNIRYGRLDATDEECMEAARLIYADEFIEKLPHGYHTRISERGSELSTGERQLLSFARVVISDPRILILDEATSSIDTKTEKLIQMALDRLLEGRTSFIIAHRLSTIKKADQIMYIANQGIAECGTHEELLQKRGYYYELTKAQYEALLST